MGGNCGIRKVVTKGFCGGVVILDFISELKKDCKRLSDPEKRPEWG